MIVTWPAIFKLSVCDELIYLDNINALNELIAESFLPIDTEDYIVDSLGLVYSIEQSLSSNPCLYSHQIEMHRLNELVKRHYVQANQCCISKIHISQYSEAIAAVKLITV